MWVLPFPTHACMILWKALGSSGNGEAFGVVTMTVGSGAMVFRGHLTIPLKCQ